MDLSKISVTILVKNSQATIMQCLESVKDFKEIIILDNGSTDATLTLLREFHLKYNNLKIYQSEFIGFGPLKNKAISYASNDWILSLDSDEVLDSSCKEAIEKINFDENTIGSISRHNLYKGEWIKACGWSPDYVLRLFNKKAIQFNDKQVHEALDIKDNHKIVKLEGFITHYAFNSIDDLLNKLQRYSTLWAMQNLHKDSSVIKSITHASFNFFRNYILKNGYRYGYKGFIISTCNALGAFFKYMKLYELKYAKPKSVSLIVTTYNQPQRLALVLDSIKNLAVLPNEVIIADDGSTDETRNLINKYQEDFPCKLIHVWQEDKGFRAAKVRNEGIKCSTCEYIIFIDGDMLLNEFFIQDHLDRAVHGQFLQGNRILLSEEETNNIIAIKEHDEFAYKKAFEHKSYKNRRNSLFSSLIYNFSYIDKKFFKKHSLIKGSKSCNISFYKDDAIRCGLFDESYVGWGLEDSDFVARFLFAGGNFRRLKFKGLAYHLYHKENSRAMADENYKKYLEMIEKNK